MPKRPVFRHTNVPSFQTSGIQKVSENWIQQGSDIRTPEIQTCLKTDSKSSVFRNILKKNVLAVFHELTLIPNSETFFRIIPHYVSLSGFCIFAFFNTVSVQHPDDQSGFQMVENGNFQTMSKIQTLSQPRPCYNKRKKLFMLK